MSEQAMAVLFGYDPATGEHTADPLRGIHPSSGVDPIAWAWALKRSVEKDFPGWMWAVSGNDEAHELHTAQQLKAMLG